MEVDTDDESTVPDAEERDRCIVRAEFFVASLRDEAAAAGAGEDGVAAAVLSPHAELLAGAAPDADVADIGAVGAEVASTEFGTCRTSGFEDVSCDEEEEEDEDNEGTEGDDEEEGTEGGGGDEEGSPTTAGVDGST